MTRLQSTFVALAISTAYMLGLMIGPRGWPSVLPLIGPALSLAWIWRRQTRDAMGRFERKEDLLP